MQNLHDPRRLWVQIRFKICLAIYLIPALLVVLIVGAIGTFVVGVVRFLSLFFDPRSNRSGTPPRMPEPDSSPHVPISADLIAC